MDSEAGNGTDDKLESVLSELEDEDTAPGWEPVKIRVVDRRKGGGRRRGVMFVEVDRRSGEDRRSGSDRRKINKGK
jgi:hypothetical protein